MKKTISIFLVCFMLLNLTATIFSADDASVTNDADFNGILIMKSELGQLEDMGVMKDIGLGACQNITRAELAKTVTQLLAIPEPDLLCEYTDVSAHNPYSGSICYVTTQGIMSGYNKELFLPNKDVTYYEFIKTIITLLGYEEMAMQKGGDPHGYMTVANNLGLVIFPSGTDYTLTKEKIAKILIKAIDVPLMAKTEYDSQVVYKATDETLKSKYLGGDSLTESSGEKEMKVNTPLGGGEPSYNVIKAKTELCNYGILKGDSDGNLRLFDIITRAEATTLITRMNANFNAILKDYKFTPTFSDIENHWAAKEISFAYVSALVEGTSETTFEPDKNVNVQEFVKILVSLLGYHEMAEQQGGFPHGYMITANRLGLFEGLSLAGLDDISRGTASVMLVNSLDVPLMKQTGFGAKTEFIVMDGKNGVALETFRTILKSNSVVPLFNGPEFTSRIVQISELKAKKDGYTFENSLNKEDKATYIVNSDTYIYLSENTVELSEIKDGMYALCWYYTDDTDNIELLKIELMKQKPYGI